MSQGVMLLKNDQLFRYWVGEELDLVTMKR